MAGFAGWLGSSRPLTLLTVGRSLRARTRCYTGVLVIPPESVQRARGSNQLAEALATPDPATGDAIVKEGIHPQYEEVTVHCGCGATWKTRSTKKDMHLDICSNCHPFFTGRQKLLDIEGRVERFTKKYGTQTSEQRKTAAKAAKATKTIKAKAAKKPS